MTGAINWQDDLLTAAKQRGIPLSASDVAAIKAADDESALARWTRTGTGPDRLLSGEESDIWNYIERNRWKDPPTTNGPVSISIPHDEAGIAQVIASLEASTTAINTHAEVLEKQLLCRRTHHERMQSDHASGAIFAETLQRKREAQAQQIKFLNVEVLTNIEAQLKAMQGKADKALKAVPAMVAEKLNSDDRLLESLEHLTDRDPAAIDLKLSTQQDRADNLISAMQKATSLSLKDRLDRIYLEELHRDSANDIAGDEKNEQEGLQLDEDLQVLYAEIDDVAAMLTQHEHGDTLNKTLQSWRLSSAKQASITRQKVHEKLLILTQNLNNLAHRYESLKSHRLVLHQMQAHTRHIQGTRAPTIPNAINATTHPTTPALTALMQHLDIHQPNPKQPEESRHESMSTQVASLRKLLQQTTPAIENKITTTTAQRSRDIKTLVTNVDADNIRDEQGQLIHELDQATMHAKLDVEQITQNDEAEGARTEFVMEWRDK